MMYYVIECCWSYLIITSSKNSVQKFIIQTVTALNDEKYYELIILAQNIHGKFKRGAKFSSQHQNNVYKTERPPNGEDEVWFIIDPSVDMIQEYDSR